MKKFYSFMLLIMAAMMAIPAHALTWPEASTADNPKLYYIVNTRRNSYCKFTTNTKFMDQTNTPTAECMFWFEYGAEVTGFADGNCPDYRNVIIHNICTNQTINDRDQWVNGGLEKMFPAPQKKDEAFSINIRSGWDDAWNDNNGTTIQTWTANDAGSMFWIREVPAEDYPQMGEITWNLTKDGTTVESITTKVIPGKTYTQPYQYTKTTKAGEPTAVATAEAQTVDVPNNVAAPIKFGADYKTATWYRISLRSKWTTFEEESGKFKNVADKPETLTVNDMFAFVGDENGFKILNAGSGKANALGYKAGALVAVPNAEAITWEMVNGSGSNLVMRNTKNQMGYINDNNNYFNYWYCTRSMTDGGSTFVFEAINDEDAQALINQYVDVTYEIYYGDVKIGEESTLAKNGATPGISPTNMVGYYTYTYDCETITPENELIRVDAHWNNDLFTISESRADAKWNKATLRNKQVAYDKATDLFTCTAVGAEGLRGDLNCFFAFVGNPIDGFKIYNAANMADKALGGSIENGVPGRLHPTAEADAAVFMPMWGNNGFVFINKEGTNSYLNESGDAGFVSYWISSAAINDMGSTWKFTAANEEENDVISTTKLLTYNYYLNGKLVKTEDILVAKGQDFPEATTAAYCTVTGVPEGAVEDNGVYDLTVNTTLPFELSDDYASATWYKLLNKRGEDYYYMFNDGNAEKYEMKKGVANVDAALWAFTGNPYEGFKLMNKAAGAGKYLYKDTPANGAYPLMSTNATVWSLSKSEVSWADGNDFCIGANGVFLNNYGNANFLSFWQNGPSDQGSAWTVIPVDGDICATYTEIEVGAAGYATTVQATDVQMAAGLEAYAGTVNGNYVVLNKVAGAVPANSPVIVKVEVAGEYIPGKYILGITEGAAALENNDLKGSVTETVEADGSQYVLAQPAGEEVGFYQAEAGTIIEAGEAYVQVEGSSARAFIITEGTTGIKALNTGIEDSHIYNLAGQRLNKAQKGVNIIDGKKVMK